MHAVTVLRENLKGYQTISIYVDPYKIPTSPPFPHTTWNGWPCLENALISRSASRPFPLQAHQPYIYQSPQNRKVHGMAGLGDSRVCGPVVSVLGTCVLGLVLALGADAGASEQHPASDTPLHPASGQQVSRFTIHNKQSLLLFISGIYFVDEYILRVAHCLC